MTERCFCGSAPGSVGNCPTHGIFAPTAAGRRIPVAERMPEEGGPWVLVREADGLFDIAGRRGSYWDTGDRPGVANVTHWAEIRKP